MRFSEIICEDKDDIEQVIIDLISASSAEGVDSISLDTIRGSLQDMGMDIDHEMLFDLLDKMPIVTNIKDDVAFFGNDNEVDSELSVDRQKMKVDSMAKQKVNKSFKKSNKTDFKQDFGKDFK